MRKVIFTLTTVFIIAVGTSSCTSSTDSFEEVIEETEFDSGLTAVTDDKEENSGGPN